MQTCCPSHAAARAHADRARITRRLDRVAMALSSICLVHCVALPALILMLPALSFVLPETPWLHAALLLIAVPLSGLAFWRGWRAHGAGRPALVGAAGLAVLSIALVAHNGGHGLADAALTVTGGLIVAIGHWLNWRAGLLGVEASGAIL